LKIVGKLFERILGEYTCNFARYSLQNTSNKGIGYFFTVIKGLSQIVTSCFVINQVVTCYTVTRNLKKT
jgi:hypothetical protein